VFGGYPPALPCPPPPPASSILALVKAYRRLSCVISLVISRRIAENADFDPRLRRDEDLRLRSGRFPCHLIAAASGERWNFLFFCFSDLDLVSRINFALIPGAIEYRVGDRRAHVLSRISTRLLFTFYVK